MTHSRRQFLQIASAGAASAANASRSPGRSFPHSFAIGLPTTGFILKKSAKPQPEVAQTGSVAHESRWPANERFVLSLPILPAFFWQWHAGCI